MPELPDVEAIIKGIRGYIAGRTIKEISIFDRKLGTPFRYRSLSGKRISSITRRGKYILFTVGYSKYMIFHMRMTGMLLISNPTEEIDAHTRLIIILDCGRELRFVDPRRLGTVQVVEGKDLSTIPCLSRIGPEPLSNDFTLRSFTERLKKRRGMIKSILMDQGFVAGIGNIYGDEILFQSGISPQRRVSTLSARDVKILYRKIRYVLGKASEQDADLSSLKKWFVHGRREGICVKCKGSLSRVRIGGRYSYYCGICQK